MVCFIAWGATIAGGVQSLIINLTTQLSNEGAEVAIIGYKDCHIVTLLIKNHVKFNFVDLQSIQRQELKFILNTGVVIFTSFSPQMRLFKLRGANVRVLYWNVFPTRLHDANKFGFINLKFLTKFLTKYLIINNSCVFMDNHGADETLNIFKNKPINFEVQYLPIPIKTENNFYKTGIYKFNLKKIINISYVGRGSIWKIKPILKFIDDLNSIKLGTKQIVFHIITQEPQNYKDQIEKNSYSKNIKFKYLVNVFGEEYHEYLKNNISLHIGMGTAALDGAAIGIPTIVIDFTMEEMPTNYKYRWLFETEDFDLGHDSNKFYNSNGHSLKEIINPFLNNNIILIDKLSVKTFSYVKTNHNLEIVSNLLLKYASQANAKIKTVLRLTLINYYVIKRLLSLFAKNKEKYN